MNELLPMFMTVAVGDSELLRGLMGAAAQGLSLAAIFFIIPAILQGAGGAFGKMIGNLNNKNRGPIDRLRKFGDEEAKFIGAKQRGKFRSKYETNQQKRDDKGNPMFDSEGKPVMETAYRKRGRFVRGMDKRAYQRTGIEAESEQLKAGMLSEETAFNPTYQAKVAGASMYGVSSQREAALARTRARASAAYSKTLGESKDVMKGEIVDDNLDLNQITQLAYAQKPVVHGGKTYGSQYQAAAIDILANQGQADRLVGVLQSGVSDDARGSVEYTLRTSYDKFKSKGHILNDPTVLAEFAQTGKINSETLDKAVKKIADLTPLELSTQKDGVIERVKAQVEAGTLDPTDVEMIRSTARQVFQSQAAQAQLSGKNRAVLREIAQLPQDKMP